RPGGTGDGPAAVPGPAALRAPAVRLPLPAHPHLLDGARHLPDSVHGGTRHPVSLPGRRRDVGARPLRALRSVSQREASTIGPVGSGTPPSGSIVTANALAGTPSVGSSFR